MAASTAGGYTWSDLVLRFVELAKAPKKHKPVVLSTFLEELDFAEVQITPERILLPENVIPLSHEFWNVFCAETDFIVAPNPDAKVQVISDVISRSTTPPVATTGIVEDLFGTLDRIVFLDKPKERSEALLHALHASAAERAAVEVAVRLLTGSLLSWVDLTEEEVAGSIAEHRAKPKPGESSVLFQKVLPMLLVKTGANQTDFKEKIIAACGTTFWLETKFDGERMVVHKSGSVYRFMTRNGIDYSVQLGKHASELFAARLEPFFADGIRHVVLDCELLVWDRQQGRLVGKNEQASDGRIYDVKHLLETVDDDDRPVTRVLCVFDVLHLNGRDLTNWTLNSRLRLRERIFRNDLTAGDAVLLSEYTLCTHRSGFLEYYQSAMDNRLEGVVVKSCYSTYCAGSRARKNGWFKVKPDYGSHNTLDLAVVAVRVTGATGHFVHAFELGALVQKQPLLFRVVGSVTAAIKKTERGRLLALLRGPEDSFLDNRLPTWIQRTQAIDKAVRYVRPKNIIVVEVRASGVMRGSLRFPSIVCIRGDKDVPDIDTYDAIVEFEKKLREAANIAETSVRQVRKRQIRSTIPQSFKRARPLQVEDDGDSEPPVEVCVLHAPSLPTNLDAIRARGLRLKPNFTKTCQVIVADDLTSFRVKSAMRQNMCHVVHSSWLKRCAVADELVPWKSDEVLYDCAEANFTLDDENEDEDDDAASTGSLPEIERVTFEEEEGEDADGQ